jgi:single-stranded-DNA-specific exonuclease
MSNVVLKKMVPKIDLLELENTNLTPLQKIIVANRVNVDMNKEYGYTVNDAFNSKFDPIKNIHLLPDIEKAGEMIATAIKNGKHILLVSDMDADGITSSAVLHNSFRDILKVDKDNFRSIVNRRLVGNGFNKELVSRIKEIHQEWHVDMVITADHGEVTH